MKTIAINDDPYNKAFAVSNVHSLIIESDQDLWAAGKNNHYQLGQKN